MQGRDVELSSGDSAPFTLAEMFRGKLPEEWRLDYAGAFDWGPDIDREIVEE